MFPFSSSSSSSRSASLFLLTLLLLLNTSVHGASLFGNGGPSRSEKALQEQQLQSEMIALRQSGVSEVGHSNEAAALRNYQLRKKKRKGILVKRQASLAEVLFPGVTPEVYMPNESLYAMTNLVQSKKTHVPFQFYDLPTCRPPVLGSLRSSSNTATTTHRHARQNLGSRLQGSAAMTPAPFEFTVGVNTTCRILCQVDIGLRKLKWMRKLVDQQYRIHLTLDTLPVLMRSLQWRYAVRGYPAGFVAGPDYTGRGSTDEYFIYNHLRFTITYKQVQADNGNNGGGGLHITGFDVLPVSIQHAKDLSTCGSKSLKSFDANAENPVPPVPKMDPIVNNPTTYLPLRVGALGEDLSVYYSYEVEWIQSELDWADRWDVYLIGSPDDGIHYFAIVNSLMIVLFLTGAIAVIMIRALRKDISAYNEMSLLADDDGSEETGWKLLHGDVFRPPAHPMLLSILVGTGAQIGTAFFCCMMAAVVGLVNPIKKGQTLTAFLVLFVLSGSAAGYVSSRIYKYCGAAQWKTVTLYTATALPGSVMVMFTILNVFLSFAGAATAVGFLTLLAVFSLWVCVSAPLVFVGSFFGFRAPRLEVPTKTKQIARIVPPASSLPWYGTPPVSFLLGGILPFGSVCIELFFLMSALWLHQIYYVMGFLLVVLLILAATCAQVSIVMDYLQLCSEDYHWWWKSFGNCASAGLYLFAYSLWFLVSRLDLVGVLPVIVYLTYMGMISLCFGLFCGCVGFICAFWFNRTIYGAVKVD